MRMRYVTAAVLSCLLCACGVFKSSTSQASFESSSKSSSSSSPGDSERFAFQRDVQEYTATHAASGGDVGSFARDLGTIAETHGVTDWERSDVACVAIGRGLAQAGVKRTQAEAFGRALSGSNSETLARIVSGYSDPPVR